MSWVTRWGARYGNFDVPQTLRPSRCIHQLQAQVAPGRLDSVEGWLAINDAAQ